jgi:radical SAM superfamily enzyme YgiQ (UPF0313 family)
LKKVFLISINKCKYPYPVYPIGLSLVANSLINNGFEVKLFDMGLQDDLLEIQVKEFSPDFIGLSMRNIDDLRIVNTSYYIPELNMIMNRIRSMTSVPIILGGSAFSLFPDRLLELSNADYGIKSEGELAIIQILKLLSTTIDPEESQLEMINGLVYRASGSIKMNHTSPLNPDEIPFAYREQSIESHYLSSSGIVNIQTQRGCPCSCCYCTYPLIEGSEVRFRSAEQVVEEMISAKIKNSNNYFFIVDSVFNTSCEHVNAICEEMIRREVNAKWGCFLKPSNLTLEQMNLMSRAGLKHIEFGSDSFCDTVLNEYCKEFSFEDIYKASEWARLNQIYYAHFLIAGGPGETEVTLKKTFENSKKLKKTVIFIYTGMRIFPGTSLYKRAIKEHIITETSDCLKPLFYISPSVSKERISILLNDFHKQMPNWVINNPPSEIVEVMNGLWKKGVCGPLWEYLIK